MNSNLSNAALTSEVIDRVNETRLCHARSEIQHHVARILNLQFEIQQLHDEIAAKNKAIAETRIEMSKITYTPVNPADVLGTTPA